MSSEAVNKAWKTRRKRSQCWQVITQDGVHIGPLTKKVAQAERRRYIATHEGKGAKVVKIK